MTLTGKGFFIWQIPKCDGGDPAKIAARAAAADLSHVLIKIADGADWPYNVDLDTKVDYVPSVRDALREKGLQVWGWQYVRGDNPEGEAQLAIQRMRALGLDGFVIDAEREYQDLAKWSAARRYMLKLRSALPETPMALSTYRYPRLHPRLPYSEFLTYCDYSMPQVYFMEAHNPEEQLQRTADEYSTLQPVRPIIPTAPTCATSTWRPTADEITRFFVKAKDLGMPAANAWSWDYACRSAYADLWDAVARFDWPPTPDSVPMAKQVVEGLNRRDPIFMSSLYHENAAHVTGARTIVGKEAIQGWYESLFQRLLPEATFELSGYESNECSHHFTWTAVSTKGNVSDGNDTVGVRGDKIQYHYTYFTIS
jgi:hypothetical protein